ncbi:hypothetical protein CFE_1782 [Carboxydocella thermautotrophica]|uniref:Uncharacterized protein n=1 Tax=Carboxydocella thermautotrophica TaxID=178899 RepID=A0A2R4N1I3_CARTR|nr:hypothetical protein CFE_1782 [Carboxydocella thermautotrophica]AVX31367.1 hypothetical protein CTH_1795 [Carboxydocella thermautotrophica]
MVKPVQPDNAEAAVKCPQCGNSVFRNPENKCDV